MNVANRLDALLSRLNEDSREILQRIYDCKETRLCQLHCTLGLDGISKHLKRLESMGLVVTQGKSWNCTWMGAGVVNWRRQLLQEAAGAPSQVPQPRACENGVSLGPPCDDYREMFFQRNFCWCCRPRFHHLSQLIRAAECLLPQNAALIE